MMIAVEKGAGLQSGSTGSFVPIVWCCFLFVVTLLAGLSQTSIAQADDIGLNFDLASSDQTASEPLARGQTANSQPIASPPVQQTILASHSAAPRSSAPDPIAFNLPAAPAVSSEVAVSSEEVAVSSKVAVPADRSAHASDADIFLGGSDSLVARAVGSAEGTRTPRGDRTSAYYGHVDPGNGVWNLGSFSYQHGATSPQEADAKQLKRLQAQAATLQAKAEAYNLSLTLAEKLNGIDLANQSPRAALDREGYIDRLAQAREIGLQGSEAVLWARTRSFLDPDSQRWNAPGLGNNVYSISRDQERRQQAIEQAIAAEQPTRLPPPPDTAADPTKNRPPDTEPPPPPAIDRLMQIDLSPPANP